MIEDILIEFRFVKSENDNEWKRDNWIARIIDNDIEIYVDSISKQHNQYYKGKTVDLRNILNTI